MSDQPTIYLTNAASREAPYRGPGRVWTTMALPRVGYGEAGEGSVPVLVPPLEWVRAAKAGALAWKTYKADYKALVLRKSWDLAPGALLAAPMAPKGSPVTPVVVRSGDTLICACSRSKAAQGRCHRVWAADLLFGAGWSVVLDGNPYAPMLYTELLEWRRRQGA